MASYSIAEAKNQLPRLVDRAAAGEEVVITRRGRVVATLKSPERPGPKAPLTAEELEALRVKLPEPVDGAALVRRMRDAGY